MIYFSVFIYPNVIIILKNIIVILITFDYSHINYIIMTNNYSSNCKITNWILFFIIKIIVNNTYFT